MMSSSTSLPPSGSFSTPFTFDSESMFEHHPIRYLLQCARHNPATGTAAAASTTPSTASNPQTLALKLRIPATDTRTDTDGKKTYTVFHIQIIACCSSFSVVRRYSDFCDLHRDLTAEFAASNSNSSNSGSSNNNNASALSRLPALPPKKFLGSSLDSDFVSTRRAALENYLIKLFQEQTFLHSRSLSQFFVCVKEVPTVNVKVGAQSSSSSRTQSLASESDIDVASMSTRMSSLTAHLLSLEQKLKWLEAASGMPLSLEHEVKSMASTIDSLKKKVGVLELTQPYHQQMNQTMNQSRTNSGNSGIVVGPGVNSSMNGNAKPFQSQHRSVSGPVGSLIRYDFDHNEDALDGAALPHHLQQSHNNLDDDEADDDFGILPRRSISQRVASREKRAFLSTNHHLNTGGWPSSSTIFSQTGNSNTLGGVSAFSNDSTHSQGSPTDVTGEEESRGRSLSESHIDRDRLNAQLFGGSAHASSSHNQHLNRPTSSTSSSSTGKHRTEGGNVSMRSVLDNTSRSLSNVDPWLSHRFQLRNRTESVTSVIGAQSQAPRLTTRQHSDPLAANPNAAGATHWYKQWVEDLGIEVQQAVAKDDAEAKFLQSLHKSATDSGSLTDRSKVDSLFAGSFPFLSKRGSGNASNSNSNSGPTTSQENKNLSSSTSSLFSVGLPLVINPTASSSSASVSSSAANATSVAASTTLASPVKNTSSGLPPTSPAIDVPTKASSSAHRGSALLSTSPDLPQSPELGGSPNLGVSPELHQLANADKRSTLSPRAYGISPVNLSTIFPPPNLNKARSGSMDEDIDDKSTFTLNFEKEKVNASSAKSDSSKDQSLLPAPTTSALTTSLASTLPLEDPLLDLETQHPLFVSCMDASLNTRMNDLLVFISPSTSSESRYTAVLHYIENLIKRQIGAEVFCHGSFALKTYLPDADLDVSAFFSKVHEDTWVQKLVGALCQEAAIPTHGQQFAVKSVSFINAVVQVVKCNIGNINVDVSGNQTGALATLALFEEVDKLVGQNHLFKRTIILTKTWCQNEAGIVESGAGMLSSYCIRALVLFIFNAYHQHIKTPLQGLYFLLSYFGQFDFLEHAVGLFGPIQLSALPKFQVVTEGPCAWPADAVPLISQQLLSTYSLVATAPAVGSSHKHKARENDTLPRTYINVTDPCNPFNNLGRSVSQQNSATVRQAFKDGSKNMRKILQEWMSTKDTRRRNEEDLMRKSGATSLSAEEQQSLDDMEAMESFKLVSKLFSKTLSLYGSFGGRGRFVAPVRGKRMIVRNGLLTLSEGSTSTSQAVSGTASPAAFHSSPAMRPAPTPVADVPSDAETVVMDTRAADESTKAAAVPAPTTAPTAAAASAAVTPAVTTPTASTPLDANLSRILENLNQARQFETPDVSETELVTMIRRLLLQYGSVPVGKLGSLLHNVMGNHSLPSIMKERYGGLKRFLEKHPDSFLIASDHPFNPSTSLSPSALLLAQKEDEERNLQEQQAQMAQMAANGGNMAHGQHSHLSPPPHGGAGGYHNNSSPHYGHSNNRQGGQHSGDRSHYTSPNDRRGGGGNHMGMRNMPYGNQSNSGHHMQQQQHYQNGPHHNQYNKQSNMNNRGTFGHQHQQPQQQQMQQQQMQQHANLGQSNVNAYGHSNLMPHGNNMNFQSHPTSPPLPMQTLPQPNISYQNNVPNVNLNNYVLNANARGPMQSMGHTQQQQQMMPQSLPPHYGVVDNDYNDFPTLNSVLKQHR